MILKLLLKIWPSFTPIIAYIIWVYVIEKIIKRFLLKKVNNKVVDGEYKVVGKKSTEKKNDDDVQVRAFSLRNRRFVVILYITFILGIITLINTAFGLI